MEKEEIKNVLKCKPKKQITGNDYLNSGSTLLNLCCTNNPDWGYVKGYYYRFVGDSRSGKTFLCLTCLAEAAKNPSFDNYRLIYDNVERGALMDFEKFFGKKATERIEPPAYDEDDNPIYSNTIEEFYYHLDDAIKSSNPCIYILDSETSLSSEKEISEFSENKKLHDKGKESAGSYGDGKAKVHSANLRKFITPLAKTGSILIFVSQTRDNIGGRGKSVSGGKAPTFYATIILQCSVIEAIKKTVKGKARSIGNLCKIKTEKNRTSGNNEFIELPIYTHYGIDDIESCIEFLISEGHWTKSGLKIKAPEFDLVSTKEKIVRFIEKNNKEKELKETVHKVWQEIDDAMDSKRKPRYE